MKNWKTTSAGIVMIVGGILAIVYSYPNVNPELLTGELTAILGGIGLIFAKDSDNEKS